MEFKHIPVLLNESINGLNVRDNLIYVDGTLGGAGHSKKILESAKNVKLLATDLDTEALLVASVRLKEFGQNVQLIHDNFKNIPQILDDRNIDGIDGLLLDLGVSSYQLDEGSRGFSFRENAELDMRMDATQGITAFDIINTYSEEQLTKLIFENSEERFAKSIARKIVQVRQKTPIITTGDFAKVIDMGLPKYKGREYTSTVARVFQAIRIEVNSELDGLYDLIIKVSSKIKSGGRICIISFHSLEDRIVKKAFIELTTGCTCPPSFPVCVCGKTPKFRYISKKPITSSDEELKINPRAGSAKLRIIEKI
ncbi:MAG: 16S rRNA (cytosine(1402)-N(4))-methyltransferase RsmH [Clostridia bacterium]